MTCIIGTLSSPTARMSYSEITQQQKLKRNARKVCRESKETISGKSEEESKAIEGEKSFAAELRLQTN